MATPKGDKNKGSMTDRERSDASRKRMMQRWKERKKAYKKDSKKKK